VIKKRAHLQAGFAKIGAAHAELMAGTHARCCKPCSARAISEPEVGVCDPGSAHRGADELSQPKNLSPNQSNLVVLSEAESAERLGVSISTLRRWRKRGIGPKYFQLGGILRYRVADLDEFVTRNLHSGVA